MSHYTLDRKLHGEMCSTSKGENFASNISRWPCFFLNRLNIKRALNADISWLSLLPRPTKYYGTPLGKVSVRGEFCQAAKFNGVFHFSGRKTRARRPFSSRIGEMRTPLGILRSTSIERKLSIDAAVRSGVLFLSPAANRPSAPPSRILTSLTTRWVRVFSFFRVLREKLY